MPRTTSLEIQDRIARDYLAGRSIRSIQDEYSTQYTINKVINSRGIRRKYVAKTIYSVDESFFSVIDTEAKAYWLGFLYADGCVRPEFFRLNLAQKDESHVAAFKNAIKYTGPLFYSAPYARVYANKTIKSSGQAILSVSRKKMRDDLEQLGCVERKSLILQFPTPDQVPPYLLRHFIRGYFDGDGCISSNKVRDRLNYKMQLLGTAAFLEGVMQYLATEGIKPVKLGKHSNIRRIYYGGNANISALYDILYRDATVWLDRKRKIFQSCLAQGKGQKGRPRTYVFTDASGQSVIIHNLAAFCRDLGVKVQCLHRIVRGERPHFRGYRFVKFL